MYIKILIGYILGYVKVTVEGIFVERFINACISKRIFLWNMKRKRSTILDANIQLKNFRQAAKIAKQTNCRIKIKEKKGLPFLFNRYKKRKIFLFSFCFIILSIIVLSNFIWNIEIKGISNINEQEILELIQNEGVDIGKIKSKINEQEIINKIRLERNDIAWVGIQIKGTNLIVEIVEADPKPEIINKDEFCNIVAIKDGVIEKTNAINGVPAVEPGQEVKKGDILINGWIEGKYTGIRYLHAEGEVLAKIKYSKKEKIYYNQIQENETGNTETKYSIKFNNFQINFYKTLSKFEKYDTIKTENKIKIFSNYYLPIEIVKRENFEKEQKQINYTLEEAKNLGVQQIEQELEQKIENKQNIIDKYVNAIEHEEYVEVEVVYEVLESIGTKEKIAF